METKGFHDEIISIDGQSPLLIEAHDERYIDWYKQGGDTAIAISVSFGPMSAVSSASTRCRRSIKWASCTSCFTSGMTSSS